MSVILLILIGLAAGFVATKLMKVELSLIETAALGVLGALVGGFTLRMLLAASSVLLGLAGAVVGSCALIWLNRRWIRRR
ncbi:GlsB/YeaQ/YmgE family stress response membrane protein [Pikeienuella piscinae]|uniref:GlsB/YeaQ/YmgE family stress response membrane protein n=1 Tax=Pikeienuella piscinae TaxID=2748098 RepID=A0A7L5C1R8_9RHOB|nr:GlsB/YeaQ/YmgE family stress response membrane protein [Pikeienuella piscinae]QIE57088.1 GlsB/YeaQ/YmgE family stress response membrane protein [Pikeienuella piscinae]